MEQPPAAAGSPRTPATARAGRGALLGAVFLMATSAIGPGFITQTTVFTAELGAAFAFAILVSVLVDVAVQLNVWRVIGVSGLRAQDLANRALPGAGYLLAALVVFGGFVFNIGNIGGTALGANAMLGLDPRIGGAASALVAIVIFLSKRAGVAMDRIVVVLGLVMIVMVTWVAITSDPPLGEALRQTVRPDRVDFLVIVTLIGGTVGGYITYAGAHRLVDSGITGPDRVREISRVSVTGILVAGVMRGLLFLAVLGVVAGGVALSEENPPASAFEAALGEVGLIIFGVILWAAGITSVIGASYTSVSFLATFSDWLQRRRGWVVVAFIALSTVVYVALGQAPVTLLILAGALNGLILPVGLGVIVWVALRRRDLLQGYRYPLWLSLCGLAVWILTLYLAWQSLGGIAQLWE
ncbi:Mn2+/Fe2+ transporter, NRAMP family [Serinicoccus hydrothermalis]|uniref:Mn2+/Fe2+ transporter, NRAMP family n=1 Tax=Serinicoccus hydrothermalis TaxID=1758689 RepID=A0A1B1NAR2_9MICO|nr:NRAMP family divalent metal transporter [Serinicoccus hydrothermalis]ANS78519.1 Mn2+/Fe2+ transporter, NRAMP family [Serinicoccus hydrothermalis]